MPNTNILTRTQSLFLELLGKQPFSKKFYLSGGTALAEFFQRRGEKIGAGSYR